MPGLTSLPTRAKRTKLPPSEQMALEEQAKDALAARKTADRKPATRQPAPAKPSGRAGKTSKLKPFEFRRQKTESEKNWHLGDPQFLGKRKTSLAKTKARKETTSDQHRTNMTSHYGGPISSVYPPKLLGVAVSQVSRVMTEKMHNIGEATGWQPDLPAPVLEATVQMRVADSKGAPSALVPRHITPEDLDKAYGFFQNYFAKNNKPITKAAKEWADGTYGGRLGRAACMIRKGTNIIDLTDAMSKVNIKAYSSLG